MIVRLTLVLILALVAFVSRAQAGGGPESVAVVVRAGDPASQTIANHYAYMRDIPPDNFIYLNYTGSDHKTDINTFREKILGPLLTELSKRKLLPQIDCITYSTGFPTAVNIHPDVPESQRKDVKFPEASINGLTYLMQPTLQKNASAYLSLTSNQYMRLRDTLEGQYFQLETRAVQGSTQGVIFGGAFARAPAPFEDRSSIGSHGFRSWYGWGPNGELWETGGNQYVLSTVLGTTFGRGNTVSEILFYLQRSVAADGAMPTGTIYFMDSREANDPRVAPRRGGFDFAISQLQQLGIAAERLTGPIPQNKPDVQGLLCGVADFNWPASGSTIRPGAICESLTSYAGMMAPNASQTPLSEFMRNGASGSCGPVIEPYNIGNKFPHAMIQVHYARGCCLAEAFYQSLYAPFQQLIVGDPLCRPWANIPRVAVGGVTMGDTLKGVVTLQPTAQMARGAKVDRFQLFVDGVRTAQCAAGESLQLDTARYCDGYHELRVVGIEGGPIESQGRRIIPVQFNNYSKTMQFTVTPSGRIKSSDTLTLSANAPGAVGVAFYHQGRVVAKFKGAQGEATVSAATLGEGPVTLTAIGWGSGDATQNVFATPVRLTVGK